MKKKIRFMIPICLIIFAIIIIPISYSWQGESKSEMSVNLLKIEYTDGMSTISGNITNNTDKDIDVSSFSIILFDHDQELFKEPLYLGSILKKNETKPFQMQVTEDLSNITEASYQLVK